MPSAAHAFPATRRSYRLVRTNDGLHLQQHEEPTPVPASGHVLVKIRAASLNYRDLLVQRGELGDVRNGLIPLSDGAGEIVAIGADVSTWRIGDRVAPTFYLRWVEGPYREAYGSTALGGGETDGVLADVIDVPQASLVRIPDAMSFEEAATLPCAALTAWQALVVRGHLRKEDTVLVQGTGGVALFGVQIANAIGARSIVLSSSEGKRERATALGASATVNYRARPDWDVAVRELTDGLGVSHILEIGGPDTFERSLRSLAAAGHIAQIGVLTGFGPSANLMRLQLINGTIDGINVGSAEQFAAMNAFFTEHRITPVIDRVFALDDVEAAYDALASGQHFGKLVIRF